MFKAIVSSIVLSFTLGFVALAEEPPPLVTDRPDVTESAETVRRGAVQLELGYLFARFSDDFESVDVQAMPATLIRVGLDPRVELRIEWAGLLGESRESGGLRSEESGSGNTVFGVKFKVREEQGASPQLAVLVDAVLPTGSKSFRADRLEPAVRVAASHTLTERIGLAYNLGFGALTLDESPSDFDTRGLGRYSVSLAIAVHDKVGSFVELFGFLPTEGGPAHALDAGFTWLTSPNVQLDLSGGVGLNDRAQDWFVGGGVSFRLPR